jgi:iron complex outermembrane receptor protein
MITANAMMHRHFWRRRALALCGVACLHAPALGQSSEPLTGLSIEQLAELEVTSASKRAEPLSGVPAALFIITDADIIRSGATSLPEMLRLAPNLDVQRIDARQYAVTARGFQGAETANKLLVQIDGRSIYSTLFSGVFWDLFDVPAEDVERIEVVSGPGGTLYGINAVNGVINILSKDARDTQGFVGRATAGDFERTAVLRWGGRLGGDGGIRVYASGFDRSGFPAEGARGDLPDGGKGVQLGFRADLGANASQFTVQGDVFAHDTGNGRNDGQNILGRWTVTDGDAAETQVQAYYARYARRFERVSDRLEMADLSVQHNRTIGRHQVVAGAGVRMTHDAFINPVNFFQLNPRSRSLWFWNAFAQDRIDLGAGLALTGGVKLEQISYTGVQVLPSVRLAWQVAPEHLLWGAVARAVRTPSRIDRQLEAPGILRAGTFRPEQLTAVELGYRGQPARGVSLSVNLFYNRYDRLRTTRPDPVTIFPVELANGLRGENWGVEAWAAWQATPWWRLTAGLATLGQNFELRPGERDIENGISLGNDPDHHWQLGSRMDLSDKLALELQLRGYASRPNPRVPAYQDLNARLGWRVAPRFELFVTGVNLLDARRPESADTDRGQLVRRTISAGLRFGL